MFGARVYAVTVAREEKSISDSILVLVKFSRKLYAYKLYVLYMTTCESHICVLKDLQNFLYNWDFKESEAMIL